VLEISADDQPRKALPREIGNFGLRGSLSARLAGTIAVNVTQVMISSKGLEIGAVIGMPAAAAVPWEMYGPPHDCKQNPCREWFGLLKCIRPVFGAKLLAIVESARRLSIKWVELVKGSHSHAGLSSASSDRLPTH
jgi:hypothetical protein